MKDIAARFGVSVSTVSRALNGSKRISSDKREAICEYARQNRFYPNSFAKTLRSFKVRPPKVIGVIVPEFQHYYFSSVLTGIEEEASAWGYQIMVSMSREEYGREVKICQAFEANQVCGVIVSQAKDTRSYGHFQQLIDRGTPLVFYDRICTGVDASRVVVDDYAGALAAVEYLVKTGCRRVAFYAMGVDAEIGKNRYNGWRDALLKSGLRPDESLVRHCDNRADAEAITPDLLRRADRPDAFFCVNDDTAIGVLYTAKRMGFGVPGDISICGFTNGQRAVACDPMLTTVEQRGVEVGKEAADILINKVEGLSPIDKVEKRVVRTRLVVRGTTR